MQTSYMEYAMSVIISRALPDVRDGLKPSQRRILYAMLGAGATAGSAHQQVRGIRRRGAEAVSPARRHARLRRAGPHGAAFSLRYPLIDGQGNFGSVDGDPPAAMRYTEARLSAIAGELLADIDKNTVDFEPNYDGTEQRADRAAGAVRTCCSTARPASPSAWRPTSRRTTCARSVDARDAPDRQPGGHRRGSDQHHQRPGLPDRRHHHAAPTGIKQRLRDRPRPDHRARPAHYRGGARGRERDHHRRAAVPGQQGRRWWRRSPSW